MWHGTRLALAASSIGLIAGGPVGYAAAKYHWTRGLGISRDGAILCGWFPAVLNSVALVALAVVGAVDLVMLHIMTAPDLAALAVLTAALVGLIVTAVVILRQPDRLASVAVRVHARWSRIMRRSVDRRALHQTAGRLLEMRRILLRDGWRAPLVGALASAALDVVTLACLFVAARQPIVFSALIAGYALPQVLGQATFLPGGIGIVEGGMVGLYVALGVPAPSAVLVVLAYRGVSFWMPTLLGFPVAAFLQHEHGRRIRESRAALERVSDTATGVAFPAPRVPAQPPLRVALVTEYYYPHLGGVCEHVHFLARELRARGHVVDIITSRMKGAQPAPNFIQVGRSVPVYSNGSMARVTVGLGLRRKLRRVLREGAYDIVHVHSPLTPGLPRLAIEESEAPVVGTLHTYFEGSFLYRVFNRTVQGWLDELSAVICVSRTAVAAHERYFTADWTIIPNGIDLGMFRPDVPRPAAMVATARNILFLGRLDPRNGLQTLIAAFQQLTPRQPNARLVVVGDGPLRGHYERLAAGNPNIVFVGAVTDERPGYYAHADVYACPTTKASFGITLLEAMACATPIVCSDIVGFRDVVTHGREALLVPVDDADALATALGRVLSDCALHDRLGAAGRARAAQYAWPAVTDQIVGVYERVRALAAITR